ncbi:putative DDB1- and CUL4-associated factor 4 [Apostichopus japonicus]|uniref:Putative DDB1-and CUL4-associated factor 4 n=1 Tax=Stichopus japonicus TaxID=307972 RepID=A0A2G8KKC6_STIJA|nr:putative DDB1- and CUL4-associated factor 4 [Apostichopus japonicus]
MFLKEPSRQIPGFYYDKEKKRYFKILPGHIAESSWITTETIKEKETEEKRRNLMKQQNPPKVCFKWKIFVSCDILHQCRRESGITSIYKVFYRMQSSSHECYPESVYEPSTELQIAGINPVIQFVELDMSMSKVMVVLGSEQVSRIILGSISKDHGAKKELLLQEWQDVYIRNSTSSQISSAKLINIEQQDSSLPGNLYVLFSWTGDYSNAVQLVKCPSEKDPVSYVGYRFESPGEVISSCSWSSNPRFPAHLCIGFSKEAEIIEILSNSRQRLDTEKKEVLSQVFAKEQPVIYLGLKQGCISSYDLRAPHQPVYAMTHKSPVDKNMTILHGGCVCSLRLLKDENYLLAGSSDGTIKLWDLRQRAVLKEMYGHCNEYKFLPVNVDSSETVVYSVGQDHHTRLWSLQDSSHLKTIPAPVLGTSKTSAVFSMNWGGSGLPGTMIGAENKLFWYPF